MRIWVTGIGVVSPLARGAAATMEKLVAGERAFAPLSLFALEGARAAIAAEVAGITPELVAPPGEAESWSRTDAMAVLAVREALEQARIHPADAPVDLAIGGTTAGMFETEDVLAAMSRDSELCAPMRRLLSHPLSSTGDHVRAAVGPFRSVRSVCSACSSGANAILLAAAWLRTGRARCVVAGGADALCRLTYAGFCALGAVDPNPCRPFDRRRAGLNLGEGAAFLVLEPEEVARGRGASPIAELRGWAVGSEAHHITNPEGDGRTAARVMRAALARAGLAPTDLDYVNAHGTATPLNDAMETLALRACLGPEVERVLVSSSKGQLGHTLGAAGAIEAAVAALAVANGVVPPTRGLEEVDDACRLAHVTEARRLPVRAALSSSFGFGGTDTALVLADPGRFPDPEKARGRRVVVSAAATIGPLGASATRASGAYLEAGPPPHGGAIAFQAAEHLDVARARRLDRAARLTTVTIATALAEAGLAPAGGEPAGSEAIGAIAGAAFGNVDGCAAFMRRVADKGVKFASPADFPNLVPSSPVGHAAIYLGLRGPVLATADLGATAESAIATAAELIEAGEADAMAAGSVEQASLLIERCLARACNGVAPSAPRSEGAAALLLEAEERAAGAGRAPIATLAWWTAFRGDGRGALAAIPAPTSDRAWVVTGRASDEALRCLGGTPWDGANRREVAPRAGRHDGAGGFAAAAAIAAIATGAAEEVLVIGGAPDRGYALLFVAAGRAAPRAAT